MAVNIFRFIKLICALCIVAFIAFSWITIYAVSASLFTKITAYADYCGIITATIIVIASVFLIIRSVRKFMNN